MLVLLMTLQVRSKALASSLLRKSSYPFPSHQGFFNNSKVETLRILRPKQRSNQRQARGLPSSVLHYLVWLKRLLPPVLGAEVVGRSECLKHAMKFHRTKAAAEAGDLNALSKAASNAQQAWRTRQKCHWIRKLVIWLCRFPPGLVPGFAARYHRLHWQSQGAPPELG